MTERYLNPLSNGNSIEIYYNNELIFASHSHWLNPLFEFESWLKDNPIENKEKLSIHDSIDGRAAAILTCRLGFSNVNSDIMSTLAANYFTKKGVDFHYGRLVEKILCITEDIITDEMDTEEVYRMLAKRAGRL